MFCGERVSFITYLLIISATLVLFLLSIGCSSIRPLIFNRPKNIYANPWRDFNFKNNELKIIHFDSKGNTYTKGVLKDEILSIKKIKKVSQNGDILVHNFTNVELLHLMNIIDDEEKKTKLKVLTNCKDSMCTFVICPKVRISCNICKVMSTKGKISGTVCKNMSTSYLFDLI